MSIQTDMISRGGSVLTIMNIPAINFDQPLPELKISVSSISETVRSKIPSKQRKYDTNKKIDDLFTKYINLSGDDKNAFYQETFLALYNIYKPRIIKIVRKYRSLSTIYDEEDLNQTAFLAIIDACRSYKHKDEIQMKFATFLEWKIRNMFQRALGTKDKLVEIYTKDGQLKETMEYHKFINRKKALVAAGYTYLIKNRTCQYTEVHEDQNRGEKSNTIYTILGKYDLDSPDDAEDKADEDDVETEETLSENDEINNDDVGGAAEEEPKPSLRKRRQSFHSVQPSNNGHNDNMQIIDGIYRVYSQSAEPAPEETSEVVRRIGELYKERAEEHAKQVIPHGVMLDKGALEKWALSAIADSISSYNENCVSDARFSFYLEITMKKIVRREKENL